LDLRFFKHLFQAIEFKRTQDARSNYVESATAVAQEQYKSLTGLQAVGQVKGWKVQQIVFVGGTCGSIHESFNRNMKALGVLESKWDPIRKKLVRRLLEEQDKVLRSYFAQKKGRGARGRTGAIARAGDMSNGTCMREDSAQEGKPTVGPCSYGDDEIGLPPLPFACFWLRLKKEKMYFEKISKKSLISLVILF
jgi:hypothetical protein